MISASSKIFAGIILGSFLLSGCAGYRSVENAAQRAQLPAPGEFVTPAGVNSQKPVAAWWSQLGDVQLDQLMQQALEHNHSIRIAQASLTEARALLRNSQWNRVPGVEADVSSTRHKSSEALTGLPSVTSETYQAGLEASWELDIFGRVENGVRFSRAQTGARLADLQAAQVSVAAELASAYISLRGNQYLLKVAEDNLANQQKTYELVNAFASVGRADQLDLARAQSQLELTRAGIPPLQAQVNVALNRIGVLVAKPTAELKNQLAQSQDLPSIPTTVAVGDPLGMLQRRPDVRRAEFNLKASLAEYNIQVADFYPRVSFSGNWGYAATKWDQLGESGSETFTLMPRIHWAAFNLGRVKARVDAADARTQARLAEFEQQVLLALEETDNALQQVGREQERRQRLQDAAQASVQAATFARKKFEIGSSDFLSVLDAERTQLEVSAQLAQSDMQVLLSFISVYRSLGGGWEFASQSQVAGNP